MDIFFGALTFHVSKTQELSLVKFWSVDNRDLQPDNYFFKFPVLDVAGGDTSGKTNFTKSAASSALKYVSHNISGNLLTVIQQNRELQIESVFEQYPDTNAIRFSQKLINRSSEPVCLELANTIGFRFGRDVEKEHHNWFFHRFTNARYTESMPDVRSFYDLGLYWRNGVFQVLNIGNVSGRFNLPQGIVENRETGDFLMFQIESYAGWYVELATDNNMFSLQLGGPNAHYHAWNKVLAPGESYATVPVAVCHGKSLNKAAAEITRYRRHIKPRSEADKSLPAIYNEYMHYSWDDPFESRTLQTAPAVAKSGTQYYIIDCGWHNTPAADSTLQMYKLFGTWREDLERFPNGIQAVANYMHSLGMKFGLWIGPEVVGCENTEMLEYYGDECFMQRNGKKIFHGTGYLLDYRHPRVRDYMTKTIDRMITEYGCDYIKFDGCPNPGFGTELNATSPGDGLEGYINAFNDWSAEMMARHPDVIFEDCAGGGLRTDYKALSMFHLISTSDQTNWLHYPYITGNIFLSVLPEQAAVWSYPVDDSLYDPSDPAATNSKVSKERVILNMVNAVLGRIHLASRIHLLDAEKQALIREGVDFYNRIVPQKLQSVPYLPVGYTMFEDTLVASGIKTDDTLYLGIWNLHGDRDVTIPLPEICVKTVSIAYPAAIPIPFSFTENSLTAHFTEDAQARIFEITFQEDSLC